MWVHNAVYSLSNSDKEIILSPCGWLSDGIITAAQKLMLQHFPLLSGLQLPTLLQAWGFDVHRGDFVQFTIATGVFFQILYVKMVQLITMTACILLFPETYCLSCI